MHYHEKGQGSSTTLECVGSRLCTQVNHKIIMSNFIEQVSLPKHIQLQSCNQCDACSSKKYIAGVQMSFCKHMICPDCFVRMYYGFIEPEFFWNEPVEPIKPVYPFRDEYTNLRIYRTLPYNYNYKRWFIEDNEDLYNQLDTIEDDDIKAWFAKNELIKQYEESLLKYRADLLAYEKKMFEFDEELYYQKMLVKNTCPACKIR